MKLWGLHPKYFDKQGLLVLWKDSLEAQLYLQEEYAPCPEWIGKQIDKFNIRDTNNNWVDIFLGTYLYGIFLESSNRKYDFDKTKIYRWEFVERFYKHNTNIKNKLLIVTKKQLKKELHDLLQELDRKNITQFIKVRDMVGGQIDFEYYEPKYIESHPLFKVIETKLNKNAK